MWLSLLINNKCFHIDVCNSYYICTTNNQLLNAVEERVLVPEALLRSKWPVQLNVGMPNTNASSL